MTREREEAEAPEKAPPYDLMDAAHGFRVLGGDHKPPAMDVYRCGTCSYEWPDDGSGDEPPACPHDGSALARD